jgi:hypothetical protein
MNAQVTQYQIELLHHTLGLNERRREPYRNHFVAGNGHSDMRHLEALERAGLMERRRAPAFLADGDVVFAATDTGRDAELAALPEPKPPAKRTRYEDYLDADGCGGDSFGEFLCGVRLPSFESRQDLRRDERYGVRTITEYRMYRRFDYWTRDVQGGWCATMKDAKASYKAALKAHKAREAA